MAIAGLQHVANNLSADVEASLSGWSDYYTHLKNFEGLLGMPERRRRLQFTCFKDRLSQHQDAFTTFKASLYEKRWHEVVRFIRVLRPLLPLLHLGWDQSSYENVSVDEHSVPSAKATGRTAFSTSELTKSLHSALFWRYTDMCYLWRRCAGMALFGSQCNVSTPNENIYFV